MLYLNHRNINTLDIIHPTQYAQKQNTPTTTYNIQLVDKQLKHNQSNTTTTP